MKHILSGICLLSALALGLCGCSKTAAPVSGFPQDGVVRISTGTSAPVAKAAGDVSAYQGDNIGLFMWYTDGSDRCTKSNVKWTREASTGEWTPIEQMLWKSETDKPHVWAYAPYSDTQLVPTGEAECGKIEFSIPADQSAGIGAADLVAWGVRDYVPDHNLNPNFSEDGKIMVSFSHQLVKLTVNFFIRTQFAADVTISKVLLKGTSSKVICDLFDPSSVSKASDATDLDITFHKVSDLSYEVLFFPGTGQEPLNQMMEITMSDGTTLTYTIPAGGLFYGSDTFVSGCAYTMQVLLGKNAVGLNNVTMDEWISSGMEFDGGDATETTIP